MIRVKETVEYTILEEYTKHEGQMLIIGEKSKEKIFAKLANEVRSLAKSNGFEPIDIGYLKKINNSLWRYTFDTKFKYKDEVVYNLFYVTYEFID